jgi:hypothetical protein
MLFKVIVISMLLLIGYSLFSALFHMMKGTQHDDKMVKSLTWRVALSITLFLLLLLGLYTGVIVRVHT